MKMQGVEVPGFEDSDDEDRTTKKNKTRKNPKNFKEQIKGKSERRRGINVAIESRINIGADPENRNK